jgi:hypothetical protein
MNTPITSAWKSMFAHLDDAAVWQLVNGSRRLGAIGFKSLLFLAKVYADLTERFLDITHHLPFCMYVISKRASARAERSNQRMCRNGSQICEEEAADA